MGSALTATLLVADTVLLLVLVAGCAALGLMLMRQQGRLLLRLDALEREAAPARGMADDEEDANARRGATVGAPFTRFALRDVRGSTIELDAMRGKRVLLVHWSTQCGFCDLVAPELARLEQELARRRTTLVFASYGGAEANLAHAAEHGLTSPIVLLDPDRRELPEFSGAGTPCAYLIDEEGRVAEPLAIGYEQVAALARQAVGPKGVAAAVAKKPLTESKIVRDGLKAGTPAPAFRLADVRSGRDVALEDYRGRRVMVVFSDPHCGPCDALAPELARLHERRGEGDAAIVLVGRGDADENRQKAERHGFGFPFVVQKKWELSRAYGIFSTPVAFLVDERGTIAADVAVGVDAILALATASSAATAG